MARLRCAAGAGWTLLELLIALAVVAVLLGAAAPVAGAFLARLELRSASLRVAAAAIQTRGAAVREGRAWALVGRPRSLLAGPVGEPPALVTRLPPRVRLAAMSSRGDVRFEPTGRAENATFTLALATVSGELIGHVVVNQRGRVRVE